MATRPHAFVAMPFGIKPGPRGPAAKGQNDPIQPIDFNRVYSEYIEPALRQFEPSFQVGPVLSAPSGDVTNAVLPVPSVQGYKTEWMELGQTNPAPIPTLPPVGLLPEKRVSITEGWINLVHPD